MERRREATQKTLDRYKGKAFSWPDGVTCAHLMRFHLRNMGHKPPTVPRFRSALTATRALNSMGFADMAGVLDSLTPRLPSPAFAKLGDVAIRASSDGLGAVLICAGPRRFFGWVEGADNAVTMEVDMDTIEGVWHV